MKALTSIIVLLALAATLAGCGVGEASVSDADAVQAATPVPVEVAQPFRADLSATYAATATITSDNDAPVVARVSGEVVELLVETVEYDGEHVSVTFRPTGFRLLRDDLQETAA